MLGNLSGGRQNQRFDITPISLMPAKPDIGCISAWFCS
jgi:hypothetical protein